MTMEPKSGIAMPQGHCQATKEVLGAFDSIRGIQSLAYCCLDGVNGSNAIGIPSSLNDEREEIDSCSPVCREIGHELPFDSNTKGMGRGGGGFI